MTKHWARENGDHRTYNESNRIHNIIKQFIYFFPREFEKCDIKICGHCGGKGFTEKSKYEIYLDGLGKVCDKCDGVGYRGYTFFIEGKTCACNGTGCDVCKYNGWLDWISAARVKGMEI